MKGSRKSKTRNTEMNNNKTKLGEVATLAVGEIVVAALTALGFFLADKLFSTGFSYRVLTGALLGAAVTVLNFLFLTVSVNRAVDTYLEARGTREMSEEEAETFAKENSMAIQNTIKTSFIIRTVSILATLAVAFLLDWFNPLATVIPLLAFRPLLMLGENMRRKKDTPPNPDNFIDYSKENEEKNEEKED